MRLVFYSGGQNPSNEKIHKVLAKLARESKKSRRLSLTYIPVWAESSEAFFRRFVKRYRAVGFREFHCLPVDVPVSRKSLKRALQADAIYLAGGNTFYFLKHLRKSGVLTKLKKFAKKGGVVAGLSAGAIIMTPSIGLAAYPIFDADNNEVRLRRKHWKALGLVNFEFFPHFVSSRRYIQAMINYSRRRKRRVYACQDGGGISIRGKEVSFFGKVKCFEKGKLLSY